MAFLASLSPPDREAAHCNRGRSIPGHPLYTPGPAMSPEASTIPGKETDVPPENVAAEEPLPATPEPLVLKKGSRIQLGFRKGTVGTVRGSWKKPYDVRVVWEGEKYPQWLLFTTLELDRERGDLKILG